MLPFGGSISHGISIGGLASDAYRGASQSQSTGSSATASSGASTGNSASQNADISHDAISNLNININPIDTVTLSPAAIPLLSVNTIFGQPLSIAPPTLPAGPILPQTTPPAEPEGPEEPAEPEEPEAGPASSLFSSFASLIPAFHFPTLELNPYKIFD